jgi:hypothetical protein
VTDLRNRPVLVVGDNMSGRWDVTWALHEAGILAEQVADPERARTRAAHDTLAGVVLLDSTDPGLEEALVAEVPFVLITSRTTDPDQVVARVYALLDESGQLKL